MTNLTKFKENLVKNGYNKSGASIFYTELYQKCVTDKKGKKYFINFQQKAFPKEYDEGCFFSLDCQFNTNISNKKITVDISSNQWFNTDEEKYQDSFFPELEEIEKFVENIWQFLGKNYYENF